MKGLEKMIIVSFLEILYEWLWLKSKVKPDPVPLYYMGNLA